MTSERCTINERNTWVDVDPHALSANVAALRRIVGSDVRIWGVVKADGYGHGAIPAAQALLAGGAWGLAVATSAEGRRLRAAGIAGPILVIGYTAPEQVLDALEADLALTVCGPETFWAAAAAGRAHGRRIALHLKVDTGMHRLGLLPYEVAPFLEAAQGVGGVSWEGLSTHFACADEPWHPENAHQLICFEDVRAAVAAAGWRFPMVHAANSAAALCLPAARYDAVRPGLALYGCPPVAGRPLPPGFRPALAFRTRVVRVAQLPPGSPVSYGATYVTPGTRRLATVAAGYADGLRRSPAWRSVLIRGRRAPIVGRICMDYAMVDVSDIPGVSTGDEVTLLGTQDDAQITADEVAGWLGTSAYEVLTTLAPRQTRP
ncbi:MAG TPA: alanine racemase [Roseiflexaceae bacterium]|nr:alanine racemase [Roseiflexaceae bacterium]